MDVLHLLVHAWILDPLRLDDAAHHLSHLLLVAARLLPQGHPFRRAVRRAGVGPQQHLGVHAVRAVVVLHNLSGERQIAIAYTTLQFEVVLANAFALRGARRHADGFKAVRGDHDRFAIAVFFERAGDVRCEVFQLHGVIHVLLTIF